MQAGDKILAGPGWATVLPSLDFETYSEAGYRWNQDLNKWQSLPGIANTNRGLGVVGVRNYVEHKSFRILSAAFDLFDGRGLELWDAPHALEYPERLLDHVRRGGIVSGWNVNFEWSVWNYYCVPRLGWPVLPIEQCVCTMAKSRAFGYPGALDNAARVSRVAELKDPEGKRLLKKFSEPRRPTANDPRRCTMPDDDPEDWQRLLAYNAQDVRAEHAVAIVVPDLSDAEREIWLADQAINHRGVGVDMAAVENCISILEQAHAKYNAELAQLTNGAVAEASEVDKLTTWLRGHGYQRLGLTDDEVGAALAEDPLSAAGRRALEIRATLGSASVKKLFAFRAQSFEGRLYDLYSYFAARTGRWTGNGPQPQNLPKGEFRSLAEVEAALELIAYRCLELVEARYGDALNCIANVLRGLLVAAPGHDLICSDYSAIEGVVAAAVAGEEWRLEVFRTHGKIYEASAARTFKVPIEEFFEHKRIHGAHHPLRDKGKRIELGAGFGGWIGAMKSSYIRLDEIMTDDEIKASILDWRAASPAFPAAWGGQFVGPFRNPTPQLHGLEGCAIAAVLRPGTAYAYRGIVYQVLGDVLYCQVPDGGLICYHEPRLDPSTRPSAKPGELALTYSGWNSNPLMGPVGWVRINLYGGKAFENVVQKIARSWQAAALVRLERAGYRPVLHTHDEPVGEVPHGVGSIEQFEAIMTIPPHPAYAGWPIKAKGGWRGPRYGKFE